MVAMFLLAGSAGSVMMAPLTTSLKCARQFLGRGGASSLDPAAAEHVVEPLLVRRRVEAVDAGLAAVDQSLERECEHPHIGAFLAQIADKQLLGGLRRPWEEVRKRPRLGVVREVLGAATRNGFGNSPGSPRGVTLEAEQGDPVNPQRVEPVQWRRHSSLPPS